MTMAAAAPARRPPPPGPPASRRDEPLATHPRLVEVGGEAGQVDQGLGELLFVHGRSSSTMARRARPRWTWVFTDLFEMPGSAEAICDLGQAVVVAEHEAGPLPLGQRRQRPGDGAVLLGQHDPVVGAADQRRLGDGEVAPGHRPAAQPSPGSR